MKEWNWKMKLCDWVINYGQLLLRRMLLKFVIYVFDVVMEVD